MDDEAKTGEGVSPPQTAPVADNTPGPMPFYHYSGTAEGFADVTKQAFNHAEQYQRPIVTAMQAPDDGTQALFSVSKDGISVIDPTEFDAWREAPVRRTGTATMTSLDSFIDHSNRFKNAESAIFANDDRTKPSLLTVFDYHDAGPDNLAARHGDHRTGFAFPLSDEWKAWTKENHKPMKMAAFAQFLEQHIGDIALPEDALPEEVERFVMLNGGVERIASYGQLIELSRGLKVNESNVVEEAQTLATGEGHIRFTNENVKTSIGNQEVKVPTMFFIAIPIFNKGAFYRIAAQLRYRKVQGEGIVFWYDLWREDRSFDHAFGEAVSRAQAETELPVFFGAPEDAHPF